MNLAIQPVSVFPASAVSLYVGSNWSNSLGSAPQFYYELRDENGVNLKNGNVSMTVDQWQNWPVGADDEQYILACVSANLGLTPA